MTFKLPTPPRAYPLRSPSTALRRADRGAIPKPRRGGPLVSSEDVVMEAVKLGYKIADEQILKGQDFARKLRGAAIRSEAGEMGTLVDQGLRLARQFAVLLVEMTETTVQAPAIAKAFAKAVNEGNDDSVSKSQATEGGSSAPPRASNTKQKPVSHGIPIQVKSSRATRVSLVLYETLTALPEVYPLYAKGKKNVALDSVRFESLETNGGYVLIVEIPAAQAAGCYRGYAINPVDQKPLGSIEVTVEAK